MPFLDVVHVRQFALLFKAFSVLGCLAVFSTKKHVPGFWEHALSGVGPFPSIVGSRKGSYIDFVWELNQVGN